MRSGGLELLFDNRRKIAIKDEVKTVRDLLPLLRDTYMPDKRKQSLFLQDSDGGSVRPGILVLINDTDWELMGELEYQLKDGDTVLFISTLHGG